MHPGLIAVRAILFALIALVNSGCAISYIDKSGFEHTVGLFHQKVKVENQLLHVQRKSVGLNLSLAEGDAGFNIGYKNSYRVFVPSNTILISDIERPGSTKLELAR